MPTGLTLRMKRLSPGLRGLDSYDPVGWNRDELALTHAVGSVHKPATLEPDIGSVRRLRIPFLTEDRERDPTAKEARLRHAPNTRTL